MTEDELQRAVFDLAKLLHLRVAHFRPARTATGWRTPVAADGKGFPDLVIIGRGGVLFRELKSPRGRTSAEQDSWVCGLASAGADVAVWRPRDLTSGRIERELRALRRRP